MRLLACTFCLFAIASSAHAQVQTTPAQDRPEELEPRNIGTLGTTVVGFAGFLDSLSSSERDLPAHYTLQIDVGRFLTSKLVARGGLVGSGSRGGDPDEEATGPGAPAFHALAGALFYFTPQSMWSVYSGGEYWARLSQRADANIGSVVAKVGIQGAVTSRASLFIESGYGIGLGRSDEKTRRIVGQVGLRLKL